MPEIKKKLAVVGSRTFDDKRRLYDVLTKNRDRISMIVSGGAKGADSLAVEWATDYGIPYLVFPALWRDPDTGVLNKGAGFKRNVQIVEHSDVVMAFWDGVSAGTKHTIDMATQRKKPVKVISFTLQTKEAVPVDFKTGKPMDVAHKDLPIVPKGFGEPQEPIAVRQAYEEPKPPDTTEHEIDENVL